MTKNQINDLNFLDDITKTWLNVEINKEGPWIIKSSIKEKVNCFLGSYLGGCPDSIDVRGYLSNNDPDEIWVSSMTNHVIPYILENRGRHG